MRKQALAEHKGAVAEAQRRLAEAESRAEQMLLAAEKELGIAQVEATSVLQGSEGDAGDAEAKLRHAAKLIEATRSPGVTARQLQRQLLPKQP